MSKYLLSTWLVTFNMEFRIRVKQTHTFMNEMKWNVGHQTSQPVKMTVFYDTIKIMENRWMNLNLAEWELLLTRCFPPWIRGCMYMCLHILEIVLALFKHAEVFITNFHQVVHFQCLQTYLKRKIREKKTSQVWTSRKIIHCVCFGVYNVT